MFRSATPMGSFDLGPFEALLLGDIAADGGVTYLWALQVADKNEHGIRLMVTAETSRAQDIVGAMLGDDMSERPDLTFLCYFTRDGSHHNLGPDHDLRKAGAFLDAAIPVAIEVLNLSVAPGWVWEGRKG